MEFQPNQTDKIGQLASLLEEILLERAGDDVASRRTSKMAFSTFKQPSTSRDVFSRFYAFERSVLDLQRTLQDFSNSVQHLGSSVGVVASAYHIRFRLDGILRLFRGNVSRIHPDQPLRLPPTRNLIDPAPRSKGELTRAFHLVDPSTQALPDECIEFTKDVERFLKRIKEIPEFTDDIVAELLESTIHTLVTHVLDWMKSLAEYESLDWPDVRRFLDELSAEFQLDLERLSRSVSSFVTVGIPMIEHAQKRKANGLLNISTVATFFSGVTATAIQYSFASNDGATQQIVNFSWTSALVFSLASAINSQLAYRWQVAAHSSPDSLMPRWLTRWLMDAPLLLLVLSAALFTLGLVCFTFSAFRGSFIPITTSIFAGLTCIGMLVVGVWVVAEDITFTKTHGHHWLREILANPKVAFGEHFTWVRAMFPIFVADPAHERFSRVKRWWRRLAHGVSHSSSLSEGRLTRALHSRGATEGATEGAIQPTPTLAQPADMDLEKGYDLPRSHTPSILSPSPSPVPTPRSASIPLPEFVSSESGRASDSHSSSTLLTPQTASRSRNVTLGPSEVPSDFSTSTKRKKRGTPRTNARQPNLHSWRHADMLVSLRNIIHVHNLSDIEVPYARIMAFSPSGSHLAVLSPSQRIKIFETAGMGEAWEISPKDGALLDMQWKPQIPSSSTSMPDEEKYLLLRYKNTLRLANITKIGFNSSDSMVWHRAKTTVISASAWFREEPSFLWSEGSMVFVGHTDEQPRGQKGAGKYELYYDFQRILQDTSEDVEEQNIKVVINDLLVIPGDRLLILTVALVVDEEDDYATRNPEHRVIIFNLKKKKIESFFATFDDVNKISIHKSGMFVVISRHTRPPTVYELKHLSTPAKRPWFDPVLTCEAAPELEFIGVSFLASVLPEGGQTVMSATKDGVIHVWDRKFGTKLGELVPEDAVPGQLVDTIVWSQDKALLAVAYNKGSVRVFHVPTLLASNSRMREMGEGEHEADADDGAEGGGLRLLSMGGRGLPGRRGMGRGHVRNVSGVSSTG